MANRTVDILIIGGGLTGAVLTLALIDSGYTVLMIDSAPPSQRLQADFDSRSLALAPASIQILKTLSIWPLLEPYATPIKTIRVSEQGQFGQTTLQAKQDSPLGYVVEMYAINSILQPLLPKESLLLPARLTHLSEDCQTALLQSGEEEISVRAKIIVAADGTESTVRKLLNQSAELKSYDQEALIMNVGISKPHQGQAFERFTRTGPMALLPMSEQRMALVWSLLPKEAERLKEMDDETFLSTLQHAVGYKAGRFCKAGKRQLFPLKRLIMPKQTRWPVIFVGNAAHTLHPVAGQGFNLGLRDVAALSHVIQRHGLQPVAFDEYEQLRHYDQKTIRCFTEGLISTFAPNWPGLPSLRSLGLTLADNSPFIQRLVTRYAGGFAGFLPDLVCGIKHSWGNYE